MLLIFENMELDGEPKRVEWDLSIANSRQLIKLCAKYPDMIRTAAVNLEWYEANGGTGGTPEVKVTAEVDKLLKGIFHK